MSKKIIALALGLGLLIIGGLSVMFYIKQNELKTSIQTALNESLKQALGESPNAWQAFECKGITSIQCVSKQITLPLDEIDTILNDVTLDFSAMSSSDFKVNASVKNIDFDISIMGQSEKVTNLIRTFLPTSTACLLTLNKQNNQILSTQKCQLNTPNADYETSTTSISENPAFGKLDMVQIVHKFYTQISDQDPQETDNMLDDTSYALQDISMQVTSKNLSENTYQLYNELSTAANQEASKENYLAILQDHRQTALYALSMLGTNKEYEQAISQLLEGIVALFSGEKSFLAFNLAHKEKEKLQPQPLPKLLENISFKDYQLSIESK